MDLLSDIILALKADMQDNAGDIKAQEVAWKAHYEALGDFSSISYAALQAAMEIFSIRTGADYQRVLQSADGTRFVGTVQAYFDGFVMGAEFAKRKGLT